MEKIFLTKEQYDSLEHFELPADAWHFESDFFIDRRNPENIYKIYNFSNYRQANKKITAVNYLDRFYQETKCPGLLIQKASVFLIEGFKGILLPRVHGNEANVYLNSHHVPMSTKITILKGIGTILKNVRLYAKSHNAAFADVHGGNFMVTKDLDVIGVDTESMRLYDYPGISGYYLVNNQTIKNLEKYQTKVIEPEIPGHDIDLSTFNIKEERIVLPDSNTDIFSFIMMILEIISNEELMCTIKSEEYYRYLDYLDKLGFDSRLLECFASIYDPKIDNIDPTPYLDSLSKASRNSYLSTYRRGSR